MKQRNTPPGPVRGLFGPRASRAAVLLLAVLLLAALFACGTKSAGPGAEDQDIFEGELFASTFELDPESASALQASESDGTLRFAGTPAGLASISEGQVILAAPGPVIPQGLLRYVHGVEQDAQGLVLRTAEAPIQLAFRKLHLRFSRQVGSEGQSPTFTPLVARRMGLSQSISGSYWPDLDVDEYVFNGDGDPSTPMDQVHVAGKLAGGISYVFQLDVDWGDVFGLPDAIRSCAKKLLKGSLDCSLRSLLPEAKIEMIFTPGAEAELDLEGVAFLGYEREITVASAELDPIPIGPLWFFPEIAILAEISGEASSQFRLRTKAAISASTTVSYSSKSGGSLTPPQIESSFEAPTVEASLSAGARLRIGPRLIVALFDVAGVYGSLYAAAEVAADQADDPCWRLDGGVEGDVGFLIRSPRLPLLGSVTLASFDKDFEIASEQIASGTCSLPSGKGIPPTGGDPDLAAFSEPTFDPWARVYPDVVDGFPHEGLGAQVEWAQVTPTIDGRFMLSGSDARTLVKVDPQGQVIWARRFVADVSFWNDTLKPDLLVGRVVSASDGAMFVVAHPYTLLKVSASGQLLWARRFDVGDSYRETWLRFTDAVTDGSGGLYIIGARGTDIITPLDTADGWALRLDGQGQVLWSKALGTVEWGEIPRRAIGLTDGVALVGGLWSPDGARWRGHLARLDQTGSLQWSRGLVADDCGGGNEQRIYPTAGLLSSDGDLILGAGVMHSGYSFAVYKVKSDGALSWYQVSRSPVFNHLGPQLTDLVQLPTSGYLAAGFYVGQTNHEDVWLAGLDSVGKVQWARAYGGAQNAQNPLLTDDNYPALLLTRDGGVVIGAHSEALLGEQSMWIMKVAAKDGAITFDGSTPASTSVLSFEPDDTCLAEIDWSPSVTDHAVPLVSLEVQVETVDQTSESLAP